MQPQNPSQQCNRKPLPIKYWFRWIQCAISHLTELFIREMRRCRPGKLNTVLPGHNLDPDVCHPLPSLSYSCPIHPLSLICLHGLHAAPCLSWALVPGASSKGRRGWVWELIVLQSFSRKDPIFCLCPPLLLIILKFPFSHLCCWALICSGLCQVNWTHLSNSSRFHSVWSSANHCQTVCSKQIRNLGSGVYFYQNIHTALNHEHR